MIKGTGISKKYGTLAVLKEVSLEVKKGEIVTIVGASGAGKTTLLHILGTIDKADSGLITIDNINVSQMNENAKARFRNKHIGFVFQFHHLLPEFTALENAFLPALIAGKPKSKAIEKAKSILTYLGISERLEHKPSQLSGGEQQRVAVARALVNDPAVILADEPSGNLDSENARELHKLFFDLRDKFSQTFVIVTHNDELAAMADRKIKMKDGRLI
ncbi:MAG: Lipoprotein-releasing system ATP-binding protein LolD [Bacteroidetes bacterium ADurb.Bin408]|nr:MAG: Lipoprotein-releasing system ATP-binding protein LolD [Bacteroidetes bacterium ADurb.Bin408]